MTTIRVLSGSDVAKAVTVERVIEAVESVYAAKSTGRTEVWPTVFNVFEEGKADLDIKSGRLKDRGLYGHKTVSWFADNEGKGLPTLFGLVAVYDDATGEPYGIVDGTYITGMRTGAAGALGAKHLARADSKSLLVVGAGNQAAFQVAATLALMPSIERVSIYDRDEAKARAFVERIPARLNDEFAVDASPVRFEAAEDLEAAVRASDIIITVTSAREPIVKRTWVQPGTHFSCIGADMEGKQEIESTIMADALVFADDRTHCREVGEMELPLKQGVISEDHIAGELGDLITGAVAGRTSDDQITVFDATGMALLDIATAHIALELAEERGLGTEAQL